MAKAWKHNTTRQCVPPPPKEKKIGACNIQGLPWFTREIPWSLKLGT